MVTRRSLAVALLCLAACQSPNPVMVESRFTATPALAARNPSDIAVLPVEDGTLDRAAAKYCEFMRNELQNRLPDRLYVPLSAQVVDAALRDAAPAAGESVMTQAWWQRVAGRATEDAMLAVRIDRWDESTLLTDRRVRCQIQAALFATGGEVLWSGTMAGEIKAGGLGAAPRDKEAMGRSCAELAIGELLLQLRQRIPQ